MSRRVTTTLTTLTLTALLDHTSLALANDPPTPALSSSTGDAPERTLSTHFLSTSLFMLGNLLPEPPNYAQLNYGHRFTDTDTLIVEAITWTYQAPLGVPYGPEFEQPRNDYPGSVQSFGVGLAYQRYWWRGLFTTLHATPFFQSYYDEDGGHLQNGFQLFVVARVGYHFEFAWNRLFIEPSVAVTSWPIITNMPDSFRAQEERWPVLFGPEPGLNVGVNF